MAETKLISMPHFPDEQNCISNTIHIQRHNKRKKKFEYITATTFSHLRTPVLHSTEKTSRQTGRCESDIVR